MGGKSSGGSAKQRVAEYYMSLHTGICGRVDSIKKVWYGERVIWSGKVTENLGLDINKTGLFGGPKKEGGVKGWVDVYLGGPLQIVSPGLAQRLGVPQDEAPGFRGITSLFFRGTDGVATGGGDQRGFMFGANNPYLRPIWVTVARTPIVPVRSGEAYMIENSIPREGSEEDPGGTPQDANPVAVIAECYVNKEWGMGTGPDNIDWEAFWTARDIVRDEALGVFVTWQSSTSIESFIDDLLDLIKGAVFVAPRTGKLTLRLLREDNGYAHTGKTINEDNAVLDSFSRKGWGEITNEIVVTWTNPENEKEETVTVQNLPGITRQGAVISNAFNAYGLRTRSSATLVANRELAQEATPLISCEATCNREFWDVGPYETIDLSWAEYGISSIRMRVMKVDYGDSNSSKVKLSLIEDVYSRGSAVFLESQSTESTSRSVDPVPVVDPRIIEVPAYFASRAGVDIAASVFPDTGATVLATAPNSASSSFELQGEVVLANGLTEWQDLGGAQPFVGAGTLSTTLDQEVTTIAFTLDQVNTGFAPNQVLVIGEPTAPEETLELALVTSVDGSGAATLRRGVLDTVPRSWPVDTPVWVTTAQDWAPLPVTLTDGQEIRLRLLTQATGGRLEQEDAPVETETLTSRVTRPLRPAHLRVNDLLWPSIATDLAWPVKLTWSHRNRLLEDTVMLSWDDPGLPVEQGVEYQVTVEGLDSAGNVLGVAEVVTLTGDSYGLTDQVFTPEVFDRVAFARVSVTAQLDGLDAWQDTVTVFKAQRLLPPANLSAAYAVLDLSVSLTWDDRNGNEEGHRVYRALSPMDAEALPSPLADLDPDVTSFEDDTAAPDETYYYRVSAYKGASEAVSDEQQVTTAP